MYQWTASYYVNCLHSISLLNYVIVKSSHLNNEANMSLKLINWLVSNICTSVFLERFSVITHANKLKIIPFWWFLYSSRDTFVELYVIDRDYSTYQLPVSSSKWRVNLTNQSAAFTCDIILPKRKSRPFLIILCLSGSSLFGYLTKIKATFELIRNFTAFVYADVDIM